MEKNLLLDTYTFKTELYIYTYKVVAQLVERSIPMPEVRGSNPVIGKLLNRTFNCLPSVNCIKQMKIKIIDMIAPDLCKQIAEEKPI